MKKQEILVIKDNYWKLDNLFVLSGIKRLFLVCGRSIKGMNIGTYFENLEKRIGIKVIRFSEFTPNPIYASVVEGVKRFREADCDMIAVVGGGSAIDVAKCIKLYANMESSQNYLSQQIIPNRIKLLAVPTTAGTGSEATEFAVVYEGGEKQSISDESCIPSVVVMDPSTLETLPDYHRKSSMMDAFCHAIESFWSIHSTEESRRYSLDAIRIIMEYKDQYLTNKEEGNQQMMQGAYIAGKAINIARTTAGHAMCYKLTSLYGIAHGHAAALCVVRLWPYMITHLGKCIDPRGMTYLKKMFSDLAEAMGCAENGMAVELFADILEELGLMNRLPGGNEKINILKTSVNPIRLGNTPVLMEVEDMEYLYCQIVDTAQEEEE